MAKRASNERRRFWHDLIRRQPTSGLNIARFCDQAGVSQNSFFAWKRRFRSTDRASGPSSQEGLAASGRRRRRRNKSAAKSMSLVPVRLVADVDSRPITSGLIEIAWPDGVVLRVPAGCNGDTLREVFSLLTSAINRKSPSC
jgi:transposase-like protein